MSAVWRHDLIPVLSLAGVLLDALGGLYLAYDLLGGKHGPLRTITKSVSYGVMFGSAYGLPLGRWFGMAGLVVSGPALSLEIGRREVRHAHPLFEALAFGLLRAASFGAAGWLARDAGFEINFGILSAIGFVATYMIVGPQSAELSSSRPRIDKTVLKRALSRCIDRVGGGTGSGKTNSSSFRIPRRGSVVVSLCHNDANGRACMEDKHAGGRKPMLTPALTKLICDVIRDGAYDHVAAGSAGISYRTHLRWLELGRADDAPEPYASYHREVSAARNQVRAAVEAEIRKTNPLAWLKSGPGRDRPSQPGPGWADSNRDGTEVPQVSFRALQIEAYMQTLEREEKQAQQSLEHQPGDDSDDSSYE